MTVTDMIKFLQKYEFGGATGRPREVTFSVNGHFIGEPDVYVDSTDDGLYTGICIAIDGEVAVDDSPTVLHETDLDETEQRILRKFRELREKGRENQYIHSPTAWALYWTWRDLETWSNVLDVNGGRP